VADPSIDPVVQAHREQIASIDRQIVAALNARVALVKRLKDHKDAQGLAFVDPSQEGRVLAQVCQANGGPASDAGLRTLFATILEWTKGEVARLEGKGKAINRE
jgi:chorismate mutase